MRSIRSRVAITVLVLAWGAQGWGAETGVDHNFKDYVFIASTSPSAPTVVNTVVVVCPSAGSLIATASAQLRMETFGGFAGQASVQYGISRNSTQADASHFHVLSQYTDVGYTNGTASYQRVGTCSAGQTVTFRFVAHVIDGDSASAEKSSLVVQWIGNPRI